MIEALQTIVAACKATASVQPCTAARADYAARAIGWGFDMTTVSGDARLLAAAADASVTKFRGADR